MNKQTVMEKPESSKEGTRFEFSKEEVLFELRFWHQCMGDHIRIIYASFGPGAETYIQRGNSLIKRFDDLLERTRKPVNDQQLAAVISESLQAAEHMRDLKREILQKHLVDTIQTSLWPTFYSHALEEVGEFIRLLSYYVKGKTPPELQPLEQDLLWLLDFSNHAQAMADKLDFREEKRKERAIQFAKTFAELYVKAIDCGVR